MKSKRDILTRKVIKYKARLNMHGGQQEYAVNFFETYSPKVTWAAVRLITTLAWLNNWHTRQCDFVLDYPQAPIELDMYMELPKGIQLSSGNSKTHVLRLIKNLYGQKQAGRVWNQHLAKGLQKAGFVASRVDECVFYKGKTIFIVYGDDVIFFGPDLKDIEQAMKNLDAQGFNLDTMRDVKNYLGINFERLADGRVKISHPQLIYQILKDVGLSQVSNTNSTPCHQSILQRDLHGAPCKGKFHYRSVEGKLNFLEKGTGPDIAYNMHQCARFSKDTRASHEDAIMWLCKYLMATKDDGIIYDPKRDQSIEVLPYAPCYS
jgi:hypothetical protein